MADGAVETEGTGWTGLGLILAAMAIGGAIGIWRARAVEMTGMPELIAMLHSFVGLAAVLVGLEQLVRDRRPVPEHPRRRGVRRASSSVP